MPTVGETTRALRDRPLGRALILVVVLLVALLVARSCGKTEANVSQDEAIAIAEEQVDFEPDDVLIRLLKQGLNSREVWLVGLSEDGPDGRKANCWNVLLDANTGTVQRAFQVPC